MQQVKFFFRCRLCGNEFGHLVAGDRLAEEVISSIIVLGKDTTHGISLYLLDTHQCTDGNVGLADLIGYKYVEDC